MGAEWTGRRATQRLALIATLFLVAGASLVVRLAKIQLVDHTEMEEIAAESHYRREAMRADRGRILDREGNLLVFSTENPSIYAMRDEVLDPAGAARALAALGISERSVRDRLREAPGFSWLYRDILPDERAKEVVRGIPGVYARREWKRVYPQGSLARPLLGRWSDDEGVLHTGLELRFGDLLQGEAGWQTVIRDAVGQRYATTQTSPPRAGCDLVLTLDVRIQEIAETALAECVAAHRARGGSVVVVDPWTGDVLAMASLGQAGDATTAAITHPVEVGSCAKLVAAAAALQEGISDTTRRFFCGVREGEVDPPRVTDDHGEPGHLSMQMVIAESRNIGTARLARAVGSDLLHAYLVRFGFGERTGIELPGESSGRIAPVAAWSGRSLDSIAIGYEFLATPLQWAMAYATVANGGMLFRPRLVAEIHDPASGRVDVREPEVVRRVIDESTAEVLRSVFARVTRAGGTGLNAALPWVSVAGKTGTARKFDHEAGRYSQQRHLSSFVGFAPARDPKLVVAVMIDEPATREYYGGEVAAPVFREVVSRVAAVRPDLIREDLRELRAELPPARTAPAGEALAASGPGAGWGLPDFRGMARTPAIELARRHGLELDLRGKGERVLAQAPAPGTHGARAVALDTEQAGGEIPVPDLRGLGYREAARRLGALGLHPTRRGVGRVARQVPEPGAALEPGQLVTLVLEDRTRSW
jgi:cell division protein FtsI/penicillin-binding protein 2